MNDITATVDRYSAVWHEGDADRRHALIAQVWTDDASYVDPLMTGDGHDGIDAMIAGAEQQFPRHRFHLVAGHDMHNDRVRFEWGLHGADGPVAAGVDFAVVADDGRLRAVTGFMTVPNRGRTVQRPPT